VDRVSILDGADDGSGRFRALFRRHRFVQRRIETLAQRLDRAHAETLECQREQAASTSSIRDPPRGAPPRRSQQARAAGCRRRPRARAQNPRPRTAASRRRRAITPKITPLPKPANLMVLRVVNGHFPIDIDGEAPGSGKIGVANFVLCSEAGWNAKIRSAVRRPRKRGLHSCRPKPLYDDFGY
jgi:hypothetical protein